MGYVKYTSRFVIQWHRYAVQGTVFVNINILACFLGCFSFFNALNII